MSHFVWQQQFEMGDDLMDSQHKDLFYLAEKLISSRTKEELLQNMRHLYQHVEEHFMAEEVLMKKLNYHAYKEHKEEHNSMLKKLSNMDQKINDGHWDQSKVQGFVDKWGKHIIGSDMSFNTYMKQQQGLKVYKGGQPLTQPA